MITFLNILAALAGGKEGIQFTQGHQTTEAAPRLIVAERRFEEDEEALPIPCPHDGHPYP